MKNHLFTNARQYVGPWLHEGSGVARLRADFADILRLAAHLEGLSTDEPGIRKQGIDAYWNSSSNITEVRSNILLLRISTGGEVKRWLTAMLAAQRPCLSQPVRVVTKKQPLRKTRPSHSYPVLQSYVAGPTCSAWLKRPWSSFSDTSFSINIGMATASSPTSSSTFQQSIKLRRLSSLMLRGNPKVHILHNADDFLAERKSIEALKEALRDQVTLYPRGGHLGNLWFPKNKEHALGFFRSSP